MQNSPSSETVQYDAPKMAGLRRRVPHPLLKNFKGRQAPPFGTGTKKPMTLPKRRRAGQLEAKMRDMTTSGLFGGVKP